jgi:hypothetical protein
MSKLRRTVVASVLAAGAVTVGGVGISNALAANSHSGTTQQQGSASGSNSGDSGSATHHCPNDANDSGSSPTTTSISV